MIFLRYQNALGINLLKQRRTFTDTYLMKFKEQSQMTLIVLGGKKSMSAKNCDSHNRFRDRTIGFRVSSEEDQQINTVVELSGMTKQDYIVSKLLDRTIYVHGNCKVHRAVYDKLNEVLVELHRISNGECIDDELMANIELIAGIVNNLYIKAPNI